MPVNHQDREMPDHRERRLPGHPHDVINADTGPWRDGIVHRTHLRREVVERELKSPQRHNGVAAEVSTQVEHLGGIGHQDRAIADQLMAASRGS